jgi:uncharacterized damage-inducible protein DinB
MITPAFCVTMARYNAWQNKGLCDITEVISEEDARQDRGAFFGSIAGTLNHLLWGDTIWMSRFDGGTEPQGSFKETHLLTPNLAVWRAERAQMDGRILEWTKSLKDSDLAGDLSWYSPSLGSDATREKAVCVAHFFNHQTHHRGQVHGMLTSIGQVPAATDLILMPDIGEP